MNQVANLDYGSKTLICPSVSLFENDPHLELAKGYIEGAELHLLNFVFLHCSANYYL